LDFQSIYLNQLVNDHEDEANRWVNFYFCVFLVMVRFSFEIKVTPSKILSEVGAPSHLRAWQKLDANASVADVQKWYQDSVEENPSPELKWWERLSGSPERIRAAQAREKKLNDTVRKEKRRVQRESTC
jgi:hypothetical protein